MSCVKHAVTDADGSAPAQGGISATRLLWWHRGPERQLHSSKALFRFENDLLRF